MARTLSITKLDTATTDAYREDGVTVLRNVIPEQSKNLFALVSVLFSVYLIGGVFGKNLLHAHHNLYKAKHPFHHP